MPRSILPLAALQPGADAAVVTRGLSQSVLRSSDLCGVMNLHVVQVNYDMKQRRFQIFEADS